MVFCDTCKYVEVNPMSKPCVECDNYNKYEEGKPSTIETYKQELINKLEQLGNITLSKHDCRYFCEKKLVVLDEVLELIKDDKGREE